MRTLAFWLGTLLVLVAAACGVAALLLWLAGGRVDAASLGGIWYRLDANSLVGLQSTIENRISPSLWPPVLFVLGLPAWLTLAVPAALLLLLGRRRRHAFE